VRHNTKREEHKLPRDNDADDEGGHVLDKVAELLAEDIVHMQQDIYAHPRRRPDGGTHDEEVQG
jgi:hypothetical protein